MLGNWHGELERKYCIELISNSNLFIVTWRELPVMSVYVGCFGFTVVSRSAHLRREKGDSVTRVWIG